MEYIIFSSISPDTIDSILTKANVKFKHLTGFYEGVKEYSYLIPASKLEVIRDISIKLGEVSYLHLDDRRNATIINFKRDNEGSAIGKLVPVSKSVALNCKAYTYDASSDTYYTTIPYQINNLNTGRF